VSKSQTKPSTHRYQRSQKFGSISMVVSEKPRFQKAPIKPPKLSNPRSYSKKLYSVPQSRTVGITMKSRSHVRSYSRSQFSTKEDPRRSGVTTRPTKALSLKPIESLEESLILKGRLISPASFLRPMFRSPRNGQNRKIPQEHAALVQSKLPPLQLHTKGAQARNH
jgi:hypothetical protein